MNILLLYKPHVGIYIRILLPNNCIENTYTAANRYRKKKYWYLYRRTE